MTPSSPLSHLHLPTSSTLTLTVLTHYCTSLIPPPTSLFSFPISFFHFYSFLQMLDTLTELILDGKGDWKGQIWRFLQEVVRKQLQPKGKSKGMPYQSNIDFLETSMCLRIQRGDMGRWREMGVMRGDRGEIGRRWGRWKMGKMGEMIGYEGKCERWERWEEMREDGRWVMEDKGWVNERLAWLYFFFSSI